ncbi:MAG: YckD family protein [Marinisporobacter sp.]|jgi:hypothetical protein|nr:YckD family protein [Marinisporobacter sp.]
MKKVLTIITLICLLTLAFATFAFAAEKNEAPQWFKDMITWKKDQITKAVEDGNLTKEQANSWNEHIDYMEKWHTENGFNDRGIGFGGCHGGFRRTQESRSGFGPGMMNGYGWQNQ